MPKKTKENDVHGRSQSKVHENDVRSGGIMLKHSDINNGAGKSVKSIPSCSESWNEMCETKVEVSASKPTKQLEIVTLDPSIPPRIQNNLPGEKLKKAKKQIAAERKIKSISSSELCNEMSETKVKVTSALKPLKQPGIVTLDPYISPRIQNNLPGEKMTKKSKKKIAAGNNIKPTFASNEPCNETSETKVKANCAAKQTKTAILDPCIPSKILESSMPTGEKMPMKSKKNSVAGKGVQQAQSANDSSKEPCEKKSSETRYSKRLKQFADISIFEPLSLDDNVESPKENANLFNINSLINTEGTKYNLLYKAMTSKIENLGKGYKCLQTFRGAEMLEKSKGNPACTKGFCIGKVMFVIRKQFNKMPTGDAITPNRFASVVTLAADKVFREKLASNPSAMKKAFETIKNPFGEIHGFSVKCLPKTEEQKKLFYYYLVTTISMNSLMNVNPISCMAIAKWRLDDNNFKRLGLHNKAIDIDETYARCLSDIRATTRYVIKTKSCSFHFKADDVIDNQTVMKKMMDEFSFLKHNAVKPCAKRFQFCN